MTRRNGRILMVALIAMGWNFELCTMLGPRAPVVYALASLLIIALTIASLEWKK